MSVAEYILSITLFVQFFYYLFFYSRILFYNASSNSTIVAQHVSITLIVCAHNELENLKRLIPKLLNQNYHDFEILVMDDRSDDGSFDYFTNLYREEPKFRMLRISSVETGKNPKKNALTKAIEASKKDYILLTDADCLPVSTEWIASMSSNLSQLKQIVVGYSPYTFKNGFLNKLIQFETLFTAVHYFSFAMAGIPYMAVGRNVLYKKYLFVKNKGFSSHENTTGGDDDLFIRDVATKENVAWSLSKESYVYSNPKENWKEWFTQKRRHLSVGVHYKWKHKILLGVQLLAHIGFYLMFAVVFVTHTEAALLFLMIRSLGFMLIFVLIARKLDSTNNWVWLLLIIDVVFIFTYLLITASIVLYKRIKWN